MLIALEKRIDRLNPRLNAIIARDPSAAAAARDSAARIKGGAPRSVLEGIPFTVKDNILVAGLRCTWGSRLMQDYIPDSDELPVARLRAAGAIVVGKTNVPEFTLEGYTSNPLFGVTRNPWDTALTPGGSSGGGAAAVATGLGAFAIGTDGGGSIRRPASHGGLVGFKPSIGRVARGPSLPQILLDMEVIGTLTRTTGDCALIFQTIAAAHPQDPLSLFGRDPRRIAEPPRMLYVPRLGGAPVDPQVLASTDAAARVLAQTGMAVRLGDLPFDVSPVTDFWPLLGQVGVAHVLAQHPGKESLVGERWRSMAAEGARVPATRYLAGIEAIGAFRSTVAAAFDDVDFIMTPSAAALPWPAEQPFPEAIDGTPVGSRGHAVYTGWVNACGYPAISLPGPPTPDGLPVGFQIVGRFGADQQLIDLARRFEAANPWRDRWPAIALEG